MSTTPNDSPAAPPTVAEVAALTRRLRALTAPDHHATAAELAAFIADKSALIARIEMPPPGAPPDYDPNA